MLSFNESYSPLTEESFGWNWDGRFWSSPQPRQGGWLGGTVTYPSHELLYPWLGKSIKGFQFGDQKDWSLPLRDTDVIIHGTARCCDVGGGSNKVNGWYRRKSANIVSSGGAHVKKCVAGGCRMVTSGTCIAAVVELQITMGKALTKWVERTVELLSRDGDLPITIFKALGKAEDFGLLLLTSNMKSILDLIFHGSIFYPRSWHFCFPHQVTSGDQ